MKKSLYTALALSIMVSLCSETIAHETAALTDKDGVPAVADPNHIVIDGKKMTQSAFLEKYCVGIYPPNRTCLIVAHESRKNATRGGLPKGW